MLQQFCHIFCSSAVGMLNVMWSTVCCLTLCGTMFALPMGCGCGDSMLWNACPGSGGRTQHAQQAGQCEGRGWGSRWGRGWGRASQTRCMAPDAGEAANDLTVTVMMACFRFVHSFSCERQASFCAASSNAGSSLAASPSMSKKAVLDPCTQYLFNCKAPILHSTWGAYLTTGK